jgi:hypothetical protein
VNIHADRWLEDGGCRGLESSEGQGDVDAVWLVIMGGFRGGPERAGGGGLLWHVYQHAMLHMWWFGPPFFFSKHSSIQAFSIARCLTPLPPLPPPTPPPPPHTLISRARHRHLVQDPQEAGQQEEEGHKGGPRRPGLHHQARPGSAGRGRRRVLRLRQLPAAAFCCWFCHQQQPSASEADSAAITRNSSAVSAMSQPCACLQHQLCQEQQVATAVRAGMLPF